MTEPLTLGRLLLWGRWVALWVAEAKLLWMALGVVALALVLIFTLGASERSIRLTGLGLQILGLTTVIGGIRQTGQLFGKPTLFMAFATWVSRFPSYQPRIVGAVGTVTGKATVSGRMSVRANTSPDAPLEKRVETLEKNLGYVSEEIGQLNKGLDQTRNELKQALKNEAKERSEADNKLHERLEAAQTGGLYIAAIGTLWLFVGVSMSTASLELSRWTG